MKDSIVRICVTLLDVDPAIWRRIEVPANFTLEGLHDVLQVIMGWANYHLHHFQIGGLMYGEPTPEDRDMSRDSTTKSVCFSAGLTGYVTRNTSGSKYLAACCRKSKILSRRPQTDDNGATPRSSDNPRHISW
jgi:Plasmid pRiA4b ORF-3-like protein